MTVTAVTITRDGALEADVLAHLDAQIASTRRLLGAVLRQGAAVRSRDVDGVLAGANEIRAEMDARARLEHERSALLARAGARLALAPEQVTLEAMTALLTPEAAQRAHAVSAELRGLLDEVRREHMLNTALMRQEMAFLDQLLRLVGHEPSAGYQARGRLAPAGGDSRLRALDLHA